MKLRQIAFAAEKLEPAEEILLDVLGLEVGFRDPGVGHFGLHNGVIPVGDNFLEIVAPEAGQSDTAAGRFMARRGGDAGYMVLLHAADAAPTRARAEKLGIRAVWNSDDDGAVATHFHPVDLGGVILSVDSFAESPDPSEEWSYWRWGGPDWLSHVRAGLTEAMVGMELVNPDPARQASTWSSLLDIPCLAVEDGFDMPLPDGGIIRFRATGKDELPGIAAIDFRMADKAASLSRAKAHGLPTDADGFTMMQVRCNLI